MLDNLVVKFLKENLPVVLTVIGLVITVFYLILWKDVISPWRRRRKGWKSLEIHPLYCRELDTPSGQEWIVGGFVMTSNNREFLTQFFLEDIQRVDDALKTPLNSYYAKPNSVVIGYKPTHYPDCPQNRNHLIPMSGIEYENCDWWELAVSRSAEDWERLLENSKVNIVTEDYKDFLPEEPTTKKLKDEKKSFRKEWESKCSGKSNE